MTSGPTSICDSCALFRSDGTCKAFPSGIPRTILGEGGDHRQPVEGDHGIQYDPDPSPDAREKFHIWEGVYAHAQPILVVEIPEAEPPT